MKPIHRKLMLFKGMNRVFGVIRRYRTLNLEGITDIPRAGGAANPSPLPLYIQKKRGPQTGIFSIRRKKGTSQVDEHTGRGTTSPARLADSSQVG